MDLYKIAFLASWAPQKCLKNTVFRARRAPNLFFTHKLIFSQKIVWIENTAVLYFWKNSIDSYLTVQFVRPQAAAVNESEFLFIELSIFRVLQISMN